MKIIYKLNLFIRLLIFTILVLAFIWFCLWAGIELSNYDWEWSNNYKILAVQYIAAGAWGIFVAISPFSVGVFVVWCLNNIIKKDFV